MIAPYFGIDRQAAADLVASSSGIECGGGSERAQERKQVGFFLRG
jgi:hypothetical protein